MANHPQNPVPGVLMRHVELVNATGSKPRALIVPKIPCPNIEKTYAAVAGDDKKPDYLGLYFLSDIRPLLTSSQPYDDDAQAVRSQATVAWVVCSFINGRSIDTPRAETRSTHILSHIPAEGSQIVINGSTPRSDKESDYHAWYNVEHGPCLADVPGWNENLRYKQEKSYGDIEPASFYGVNFYGAENGLGGPIWQKSTSTDWTQRIRSNAAKPNIRRVWKVQNVE